ncbi:beta strand repeat-containing protein [Flexivirga alba]|uniref:alpha-amylase n=1 Tax=Flexivirga alba TaxID=702742 RepID=A0ABW2AF42_9MICO
MAATGGTTPYTWSATGLPAGMTLAPSTGKITGTPTTAATSAVAVTVKDAAGKTATASLSLVVASAPVALKVTTSSLPGGTVGAAYSTTLAATGGNTPYTWSATGLPAGVTLAPSTGKITGTPTTAATSTVAVTVKDAAGKTATASLSLVVAPAPVALKITTSSLPGGTVGATYSTTLAATGGTTPYTWSATGLPAGLSLDAGTGKVTGTPTAAATSSVTVTVKDAAGKTATASLSLVVAPAALKVTSTALPGGMVGASYTASLTALGGTTPYTWSATGLPAGLTLAPATGKITGTPTAAATSTVTVAVKDAGGVTANAALSLVIAPAALKITITSLAGGTVGASYSTTLAATGGTTPYTWSAIGLPTGLTLNAGTGKVTGTPTTAATSSVVVTVKDAGGMTANASLSLVVAPALVRQPDIRGTVTSAATGAPIGGVVVMTGDGLQTTTAADGTYAFSGLAVGYYQICFNAQGVASAPDGGYVSVCDFNGFELSATPDHVADKALASGGAVSGTVTSATGSSGVGGVKVWVYDNSTGNIATPFGNATTASNGTYTFNGVTPDPSRYGVCFDASAGTGGPSQAGYLSQCYKNVPWNGQWYDVPSGTSRVPTVKGSTTPGIDASVTSGSGISGKVTAAPGGAGLAGVDVAVYDSTGNQIDSVTTVASGGYSMTGIPAGSYTVCFAAGDVSGGSSTTGYLSQCYNGVAWDGSSTMPSGATRVTASAGSTKTGVNAALVSAPGITGTVTAASGGAGLSGVWVYAFDSSGNDIGQTTTGSSGTYAITDLPAGNYTVCFDSSNASGGSSVTGYLSQCYQNVPWDDSWSDIPSGTPVTAKVGLTGINASLASAGGISGTVSAASDGAKVSGATVQAYDANGSSIGTEPTTATNGTYTVAGLATGTYTICFSASDASGGSSTSGYLSQCYRGIAWDGSSAPPAGTSAVPVTAGSVKPGVDAALKSAAGISGTVTSGGAGVGGVNVEVFNSAGNQVDSAATGTTGGFSVLGLPTGSYTVCFDARYATGGGSAAGYLSQCYNGIAWSDPSSDAPPSGTTAVSVTAGSTHSGLNATLTAAGVSRGPSPPAGPGSPRYPSMCMTRTATGSRTVTPIRRVPTR